MAKKPKKNYQKYISFAAIVTILLAAFFVLKQSNFGKPIPDVTEIPQEIKDSVKDLKPQKIIQIPILMYHYVEYVKDEGDTIRKSLNIIPYVFDQQIKTLKEAGYTFITMKDLADALDSEINLPPKSIVLTFDDGYRDFYTDVFPILQKYQAKAVTYVVPDFIDRPNNMTTWMLSEVSKSGLVEVGAHTMNHAYLQGLPSQRVEYEVTESKKYLEKALGIKIVSFAYPYGAFDNEAIDAVRKAGFRSAVITVDGIYATDINRFFLNRIRPGNKYGPDLLISLGGVQVSKY